MTEIISINSIAEREKEKVINALKSGEIIAYPTDTIYGLGVDVYNSCAVQKLIELKGRDYQKPISILYPDVSLVLKDFSHLNPYQRELVKRLLPGQLTLTLPVVNRDQFPSEFVKGGYIGIRVVKFDALNRILSKYPNPISTTSVNPSGKIPAANVREILSYFDDYISIILDSGPLQALSSTVIKVYDSRYEILRHGIVTFDQIEEKVSTR
ncbi:MAG: threonylcarbamoyl-AMP synthase [Candidatus Neomarinimicrobiota bacterium]|nr:MAG: threonylcarbamoyl-AMP synthase [Candidatus Neomarinimicrobiota bacterium]